MRLHQNNLVKLLGLDDANMIMRRLNRSTISAKLVKAGETNRPLKSFGLEESIAYMSEKIRKPYHVLANLDTDKRLLKLLKGL